MDDEGSVVGTRDEVVIREYEASNVPLLNAAWAILREIEDPEIPTVSMVDLGIIRAVRFEAVQDEMDDAGGAGGTLVVELMPTFLGCPALGLMREMVEERLGRLAPVRVELVRDQAWTTARISEAGRGKLAASGFAPPPRGDLLDLPLLPPAVCPYCGAAKTHLESGFGPTPCRAIHYCRACRQPFEQFKAV